MRKCTHSYTLEENCILTKKITKCGSRTHMLILYTKNNCIYCDEVKKAFRSHRIVYEERNIANTSYLKEIQEKGARTMPFLVDTSANVAIGESQDIIDYVLEGSF